MIDPRLRIIGKRLEPVRRILVFASGKGGVGKSLCSAVAALLLAGEKRPTGLLDLDFHGASAHLFLGIEPALPEEFRGILPLEGPEGIAFMSIAAFTGEKAIPLRGGEITDALIELLTVTKWPDLDTLVVDMPPGIGDEVLDLLRFMGRGQIVVVTTPSVVALRVVKRLVDILFELKAPILGVLENRISPSLNGANEFWNETSGFPPEIPLLGPLPYSPELEMAIGNPGQLVSGSFAGELSLILNRFLTLF